ncbi:LysR family transcriptional regulator [Streptomyces ovatisporus]|uniref:LysR family transcriptional regulator n=1 Tax=Streptomyces ovatisporus TaxID=1128682 RepID=A0ABV9A542_9ACTN
MELRQMRYFLAVAECLHFSRAAELLGVSQATVSEQIRRLEGELGFPLLTRTSRHVGLTPAGHAFQQGCEPALEQLDNAALTAGDVAAGRLGRLRLGAGGAPLTRLVPAILRSLRSQAPGLTVTVSQLSITAQLTALCNGGIDAGFLRGAEAGAGLRVEPLFSENLTAVLPADHRLAEAEAVRLDQLAGETLVMWPRRDGLGFYDQIISLCAQRGFQPRTVLQAPDTTTQVALVAAGQGITIQPSTFNTLGADVTMVPIAPPTPTTTLHLAWRASADNPGLSRLVETAHRIAREQSRPADSSRRGRA